MVEVRGRDGSGGGDKEAAVNVITSEISRKITHSAFNTGAVFLWM